MTHAVLFPKILVKKTEKNVFPTKKVSKEKRFSNAFPIFFFGKVKLIMKLNFAQKRVLNNLFLLKKPIRDPKLARLGLCRFVATQYLKSGRAGILAKNCRLSSRQPAAPAD